MYVNIKKTVFLSEPSIYFYLSEVISKHITEWLNQVNILIPKTTSDRMCQAFCN